MYIKKKCVFLCCRGNWWFVGEIGGLLGILVAWWFVGNVGGLGVMWMDILLVQCDSWKMNVRFQLTVFFVLVIHYRARLFLEGSRRRVFGFWIAVLYSHMLKHIHCGYWDSYSTRMQQERIFSFVMERDFMFI